MNTIEGGQYGAGDSSSRSGFAYAAPTSAVFETPLRLTPSDTFQPPKYHYAFLVILRRRYGLPPPSSPPRTVSSPAGHSHPQPAAALPSRTSVPPRLRRTKLSSHHLQAPRRSRQMIFRFWSQFWSQFVLVQQDPPTCGSQEIRGFWPKMNGTKRTKPSEKRRVGGSIPPLATSTPPVSGPSVLLTPPQWGYF